MSKKKPTLRPAANDAEPTKKVIIPTHPRAGLFRRLGAWALDLPLVGILLAAAAFLGYGLALVRMFSSAFGLGNLLVIFDINQLAFQDHWGDCEVILLDPQDMQ